MQTGSETLSRIVKHSTHVINNDTDGYVFNHNISEGLDFNSHLHKCFEFIKVLRGRLLYNVEGTDYMLTDGDLIMTNPAELHSFSFPDPCTYDRIFLHIYPGVLRDHPELSKKLLSRPSGHFNRIPAELAEKYGIDDIFKGMERYCAEPVPETDFMMLTYIMQLITVIGRILREETEPEHPVTSNSKADSILAYIDENYSLNISLDDIAHSVYMSPSYTSRMFKKETGMTIKEYLNMRRITRAKNEIMQGGKATAIFSDCGFSDYTTFYRAFVKYVGMSPDAFRASNSKKKS